ncbi:hypothetical protein [Clostridium butyricum]|uniref:hypothetical protein n=1 Tax=Clostridium butyricum TaxID=1492 RepID=UPI00374F1B11
MIHKGFTTIIIFFLVLVVYLPVKINSEAVNVAETSKYMYDEILTNATDDASRRLIETVSNNSIETLAEGNKINYKTMEINLDQGLERFYRTLFLNLNIEEDYARQQAIKINIPIKIVTGYDGYYVDHWSTDGRGEEWSEKKLYSTIDNTNNLAIRFTLDDHVYVKNITTGREFEGKREDIASEYPRSCLGDEKTFNEVKSQVINQHIKEDIEYYTYATNEIAKRNGWDLSFNLPYWGERTITGISFIAFMQGNEIQGTVKYNNYGYSTTQIVKNKSIYGYTLSNGAKVYSNEKAGDNLVYFQNEIEAAKKGYSPDLRKIK